MTSEYASRSGECWALATFKSWLSHMITTGMLLGLLLMVCAFTMGMTLIGLAYLSMVRDTIERGNTIENYK